MDDLDSDIRAAFASTREAEGGDNREAGTAAPSDDTSPGNEGLDDGLPGQPSDAGGETAKPGTDESRASRAERARAENGRFTREDTKPKPRETKAAKVVPLKPQGGAAPALPAVVAGGPPTSDDAAPVVDPVATLGVPQSWKPAIREKWNALPQELKKHPAMVSLLEESTRREKEHAIALQESAPLRRMRQELDQVLAPVAHTMQARGVQPAQLIQGYVQADQQLSSPDQATKAMALARLIRGYGLNDEGIQHLAKAIDSPAQMQPQQQQMDPRTIAAQVRQEVMADMGRQQAQSTVAKFTADPANKFMADDRVRNRMAALFQSDASITIQDAYDEVTWSLPDIRAKLQEEQAAADAKAKAASTQRARTAAVSVRSQPAAVSSAQDADDLDGVIRAAYRSARR